MKTKIVKNVLRNMFYGMCPMKSVNMSHHFITSLAPKILVGFPSVALGTRRGVLAPSPIFTKKIKFMSVFM